MIGNASVSLLPAATARVVEKLTARGLVTLQDLWLHLPRHYEDRTRLTPIRELAIGLPAQIEGRIVAAERGFRGRPMLRVVVSDDSGAMLLLRFFHFRAAQAAQFREGGRIRCYGTPRAERHGLEIVHPSYRLLPDDSPVPLSECLEPVYPAVEGLGALTLRKLIDQAMARLPPASQLELLPESWLRALQLPSLREALLTLHHPSADVDLAALMAGEHRAQRRLALEELLAHHLSLRCRRLSMAEHRAPQLTDDELVLALQAALPFRLTRAQQRVFRQIRADLAKPEPMQRLVQGDVGSGKTVLAAMAAVLAVKHGRQAALAAPTELLAEQHFDNLQAWLTPLGIEVVWMTGKVIGKARQKVVESIANGTAQVIVGTHALMQQHLVFHDLALVIVDEQHRFGVQQRLALREKGAGDGAMPHQLVMTATPIPRTLAMTAYADLDVSVLDELPPGRTPVQTVVLSAERREALIERIRIACADARQAYWVCTLIEDSESDDPSSSDSGKGKIEAQAAQSTYEALCRQLPDLRIGLVHGRMKAKEKQQAMAAFKQGEIDLLVATTVIEVGVDVSNASLMVIENAERLGLAQLHQLRGRVGRGAALSTCVLLYQSPLSAIARQRLAIMRQTHDGFVIAEKDLQLRGPGELLGTRQTGLASFRIADLERDIALLPQVHALADRLLDEAPEIADRIVARWVGTAFRYADA